jgi:hypothetical protein
MAGHRQTRVQWDDRDKLDGIIRPVVAEMGGRAKLTTLMVKVAEALSEVEQNAHDEGDGETIDWVTRLRDGALQDFLYNRVGLEVSKQAPLTLIVGKTSKRDVALKPYQGVRNATDGTYDQLAFFGMTHAEYDVWRKQEIATIRAQSGKMQVIQVLDELWRAHPDAPTIRDLLLAAGIDLDGPRIQLAS